MPGRFPAVVGAACESPWVETRSLDAGAYAALRRRAIFDHCKWDPQVEDVATVAPFPLVLTDEAWREVSGMASRLAAEVLAAEAEIAARPDLHARLGLPRAVRKALGRAKDAGAPRGAARIARFDFHFTREGWRISEANTDVPGGINEATGLARLYAPLHPGTRPAGDPTVAYADALAVAAGPGRAVALLFATAYTDDRQVMDYLARALAARGLAPILASPEHLVWAGDGVEVALAGCRRPADLLVRFFPAEWLPNLPSSCGWDRWFAGREPAQSNPATAVAVQSKRFPLLWADLATPLPTWRALLPETRDPREVRGDPEDAWVLKPALGRVGEDVGIAGVTEAKGLAAIRRAAARSPDEWAAQRRFEVVPLVVDGRSFYPCVGVYTVDARAVGAYGRLAGRPLIDHRAQDAAVLVRA